jgi:hypothetical protein
MQDNVGWGPWSLSPDDAESFGGGKAWFESWMARPLGPLKTPGLSEQRFDGSPCQALRVHGAAEYNGFEVLVLRAH